MIDLEALKGLIDRYNVISFDAYDTLLLRPFCLPSDLYKYIENKYSVYGFASARNSVSVPQKKEKTIEDIYENMPMEFDECMKYELQEEHDTVYVNPQVFEAYQYAKESGKRIVIISDIYFHEDFLSKVLLDSGISGFERLYCSCDYQMSKCDGRLFDKVIQDLQIEVSDVLHIGDNEISDNAVPQAKGITSFQIIPNYQIYRDYRKYLPIMHTDYWDSIINKVCADNISQRSILENDSNYIWYRFGHDVAGPICWTFAKWIRDKVDKGIVDFTDIAFVARDGYLIKKMFDCLPGKKSVTSHYIYAPRILTTLLQETYSNSKDIQILSEKEQKIVNEVYGLNQLGEAERRQFVNKLASAYRAYLDDEKFGNGIIGVVDSTTNFLSSQKLVDTYTSNETCGVYWFASEYAFSKGYNIVTCQDEHYIVVESADLFELIFKSPEPTIKCFSTTGNVIFNEINENEKMRIDNFAYVEKGAMDFFNRINEFNIQGFPSASVINDYLIRFCTNPLEMERKYIEFGVSSGGIANNIFEQTKVFYDVKRSVTSKSLLKALKKKIVKHPKLFIFLRNMYHSIKR